MSSSRLLTFIIKEFKELLPPVVFFALSFNLLVLTIQLILADYLVVDVTKPYAEHGSFLEIELAARRGEAHRTCGGRTLNDDVMDTIFTLLVNAGNGPVIRDGVGRASRPASREFPYLAPPNPDPPKAPHV